MGTKLKLTRDVGSRIVSHIATGAYKKHAAEACGITEQTLHRWIALGLADDAKEPYKTFAINVRKAEGQDVVDTLKRLSESGKTDWRADAWKLERKLPKQFGARLNIRTEVEDGVRKVLEMVRPHMDAEHYAGFVRALAVATDIEGVDQAGADPDQGSGSEGEPLH